MPTRKLPRRAHLLGWCLCLALAATQQLQAFLPPAWLLGAALTLVGAYAMATVPVRALGYIPVTALLGPLASYNGPISINLGDIYLIAILAVWLAVHARRGFELGIHRAALSAIALLILVSALFSLDPQASTVTLIGLLELWLVYLLTLNTVTSHQDARFVIVSWVAGVTLASVVTIVAYARGGTLLINAPGYYQDWTTWASSYYMRATFFVTSFVFPLAVTLIIAFTALVHREYRGFRSNLLLVTVLLINTVALVLLGNKTAMAATVVGFVLVIMWPNARWSLHLRATATVLVVAAVFAIATYSLKRIMPTEQIRFLGARMVSGESFTQRLDLWTKMTPYLIEHPRVMYLGFGPDISVRRTDLTVVRDLFSAGGVPQGAVDNGYFYTILNYGIFVLLIGISILWKSLVLLLARIRAAADPLILSIAISLIAWLIMSIAQQHAVAKTVFVLVQMVALAEVSRAWPRIGTIAGGTDDHSR